jgi:hypothetical protein
MKKVILSGCFIAIVSSSLKAQQGNVAAGDNATGTNGSITYSIGQLDYINTSTASAKITEGLNQPYEIYVVTGIDEAAINLNFNVYPNPSADHVTLTAEILNNQQLNYILIDGQGKRLSREKLTSNSTVIPMGELASGIYFIQVLDNDREIKSFKVIKKK